MKNLNSYAVLVTALIIGSHNLSAQGTEFIYQGRLNSGGSPASGAYDFRFRLATDALGNNLVGTAFLTNDVTVSDGLFTTGIDFGSGVFDGGSYWLEVDVRTNGTGGYTTLAPLQPITPTPYAVMANSASNLLGILPATQLSGTVPLNQLPTSVVTNNQASVTLNNVQFDGSLNLGAESNTVDFAGGTMFRYDNLNENFFAGPDAGAAITTGTGNTGIGDFALRQNGAGYDNTALGADALQANRTGVYNSATGDFALTKNVVGSYNTANGVGALEYATNGSEDVAIGYETMEFSTNDTGSVAIGYQALQNNNAVGSGSSTGFGENTAVGFQSMESTTTGFANTAIGYSALVDNTNGNENVAAGVNAMYENRDGTGNVALGNAALGNQRGGSFNTAIGVGALIYLGLGDSAGGSSNIAVGIYAGENYDNDESGNIVIGNSGTDGDNNIIRIGGSQADTFLAGEVHTAGGLQVGANGTEFAEIQSGQAIMPLSTTVETNFTVTFPQPFGSPPKVIASISGDPGFPNVTDTFGMSIRAITTGTSFTVNVRRLDASTGWNQQLRVNWQAWQ